MDVGGMFWTKTFGDNDNEDGGDDDDVEVAVSGHRHLGTDQLVRWKF